VIVLCAAYQGDLPGLVGSRSWAPPTSSWARPADMAVVSWGARETHPAARGPHQLTMGTVVVDLSLDTSGMARRGQSVIGELCCCGEDRAGRTGGARTLGGVQ
jgi:hypothetical protein